MASLGPQFVRPLVHSPKCTLLTPLRPRSAFSMYVLSSFEIHPPDHLVASLCPQGVRPLVLLLKCTLLTIL